MPRSFIQTHSGRKPRASFEGELRHGRGQTLVEEKKTFTKSDVYIRQTWTCGCRTRYNIGEEHAPILQ